MVRIRDQPRLAPGHPGKIRATRERGPTSRQQLWRIYCHHGDERLRFIRCGLYCIRWLDSFGKCGGGKYFKLVGLERRTNVKHL
jgi:hypothetical protein